MAMVWNIGTHGYPVLPTTINMIDRFTPRSHTSMRASGTVRVSFAYNQHPNTVRKIMLMATRLVIRFGMEGVVITPLIET